MNLWLTHNDNQGYGLPNSLKLLFSESGLIFKESFWYTDELPFTAANFEVQNIFFWVKCISLYRRFSIFQYIISAIPENGGTGRFDWSYVFQH